MTRITAMTQRTADSGGRPTNEGRERLPVREAWLFGACGVAGFSASPFTVADADSDHLPHNAQRTN